MIVRILGEGQRELAEEDVPELNELDHALADAVDAGDEAGFERQLTALLLRVRTVASQCLMTCYRCRMRSCRPRAAASPRSVTCSASRV
jgi:hypothetical protein